jgi:hypothetical protein
LVHFWGHYKKRCKSSSKVVHAQDNPKLRKTKSASHVLLCFVYLFKPCIISQQFIEDFGGVVSRRAFLSSFNDLRAHVKHAVLLVGQTVKQLTQSTTFFADRKVLKKKIVAKL